MFPLLRKGHLAPCLILAAFHGCLISLAQGSQLYKWTDADGNTHYSDHSSPAGNSKPATVKPSGSSGKTQPEGSISPSWADKYQQLKEQQNLRKAGGTDALPASPARPRSLSGGKVDDGSDLARCNLARDVLSGAVRHHNGAQTDDYDRQTAENDIRTFCH